MRNKDLELCDSIVKFIDAIKFEINKDLNDTCEVTATIEVLLKTHNTWQDSEKAGVDYIYNIFSKDDLKNAIDKGLTLPDIVKLHQHVSEDDATTFFIIGGNGEPCAFKASELKRFLLSRCSEFLPFVLAYPMSYPEMYKRYITDTINTKYLCQNRT